MVHQLAPLALENAESLLLRDEEFHGTPFKLCGPRGHRTLKLHVHAVAGAANHGETVPFRVTYHRVIIFLGGAKPCGKLGHCEEVPVGGTGRIVNLLQEFFEPCRVAQRQHNIKAQGLCFRQPVQEKRLAADYVLTHMVRHHGLCLRRGFEDEEKQGGTQHDIHPA